MSISVLLIPHGFQPSYEKGFANGLSRNGLQVELIASDRTPTSEIDSAVVISNLRGSQNPHRSKLRKTINLLAYLRRLAVCLASNKADAVHLAGMLLGGTGWAAIIECHIYKWAAKRFVLTVHNIQPHDKESAKRKGILRRLYAIPHKLVVHTEQMKRTLVEEYAVSSQRIVVMHHGVDDIPLCVQVPVPAVELRVLLFGAVLPYKGIDIFLDALEYCSGYRVMAKIVGEARNPAYADAITKMLQRVPARHKVEWVRGFIPEAEVQSYFEQVDLVALPYRHIDQSGVLFTAFRFGVPVVAFNVGSFTEYLPEFAGLIATEPTPQSFAARLDTFYLKRTTYSREAIRDYATSFSWDKTVISLIPHYSA
jgi:glycosyltransferase involved in cell wall biosynthesis